jgi:hypothetical protein
MDPDGKSDTIRRIVNGNRAPYRRQRALGALSSVHNPCPLCLRFFFWSRSENRRANAHAG